MKELPPLRLIVLIAASTVLAVSAFVWGVVNSPAAELASSKSERITDDISQGGGAPGKPKITCNEPCHSKRPNIVAMHDSARDKSCFDCHRPGENLMGGGGAVGVSEAPPGNAKQASAIGGFFCSKCGVTVDVSKGSCSSCGGTLTRDGDGWRCSKCGPLVDIDKIAKLSKERPSNEVCIACHPQDEKLKNAHVQARVAEGGDWASQIENCLGCHKSHNDCNGCHFGSKK